MVRRPAGSSKPGIKVVSCRHRAGDDDGDIMFFVWELVGITAVVLISGAKYNQQISNRIPDFLYWFVAVLPADVDLSVTADTSPLISTNWAYSLVAQNALNIKNHCCALRVHNSRAVNHRRCNWHRATCASAGVCRQTVPVNYLVSGAGYGIKVRAD